MIKAKLFSTRLVSVAICFALMLTALSGFSRVSAAAVFKTLNRIESASDFLWNSPEISLTQNSSVAAMGERSISVNSNSVVNYKGFTVALPSTGYIANDDAVYFYLEAPKGSGENFWFQIFYEYQGAQITHNGDFTVYLQEVGSNEWSSTTYWNGYGPNIPYDFEGYVKIPLTGSLKLSYVSDTTINTVQMNKVDKLLFFFSNFGGQKGSFVFDSLGSIENDDNSPIVYYEDIIGDIEKDSKIDSADLTKLVKLILGIETSGILYGDLDNSGTVDIIDLVRLKKYLSNSQKYPLDTFLSGKNNISLTALSGDKSDILQNNPDRGFRLETYYTPSTNVAYPNSTVNAKTFFNSMCEQYSADNPQLAQLYFYITDYYNKDLDETVLNRIDKYFQYIRNKDQSIRLLIRFVYQWDLNDRVSCASTNQIVRHIEQLGPIITKNADVIHCWQAGFLGNWGEWHNMINDVSNSDKARILLAIAENSPADMFVQTRMVEYRNTISDSNPLKARIGYHDDYLTGWSNEWSCGLDSSSPDYLDMINSSANLLVDGEMPWSDDYYMLEQGQVLNGIEMAKYIRQRHFTSMSLIHHNDEGGGSFSIPSWKNTYINSSTLNNNNLLYAPGWLENSTGGAVNKTVFDYIRDYLGYYMVASNLSTDTTSRTADVSLTLTNYGFAAPLAMKSAELVLMDGEKNVVAISDLGALNQFQSGKAVNVNAHFSLPDSREIYYVGFRLINSAGTGAHLGNDCEFINNVNVLGRIR